MFPNRNFLRLYYPNVLFLLRETSLTVNNFYRSDLNKLNVLNVLLPPYIRVSSRKFHGKYTSSELRELKKSLWEKKLNQINITAINEATFNQKHELQDFISNRTSATEEEWDNLQQNICNMTGTLNEYNIYGKAMECCGIMRNLELAKSLLKYMKKKGKKFNQIIVIEFLNTCYACRASLKKEDINTVRFFTNHVLKKFEVMDFLVTSSVIKGLSILGDWETCLKIAKNSEINHLINGATASPLILCLLENHQFEVAREMMFEYLNKKQKLNDSIFVKWIDIFQNDPYRLEELLTIFKDYNIIPKKALCQNLIQAYSQLPPKHKLKGEFTTVKHNGKCMGCMKKLEKNLLNKDEFNELRDAFLNRVLLGDNVFKNTTPDELLSFFNVVKTLGPFDIVIDGLNVMYSQGGNKDKRTKASLLKKVVDMFFNFDKKIFIIGRKHMSRLPQNIMTDIAEKSTMFLIDEESEDDPFMIYSTLYSGPNCYFVTRDYMRSEKFRLNDDHLSDLFKRWQLSHQIVTPPGLRGDLEAPLQFKLCAQRNGPQSWHIPYHENNYTGTDLYEKVNLTKWLCLRK